MAVQFFGPRRRSEGLHGAAPSRRMPRGLQRRSKVRHLPFLEGLEERALLSALISTDQLDYAPGSTALISGSGFMPGDTITLQVTHTDGNPDVSPANDSWTVTAADDGTVTSSWYVDPDSSAGDSLRLTATDTSTGDVAIEDFTDTAVKVSTVSTSTSSGTYGAGTSIIVTVNFVFTSGGAAAAVAVTGTPALQLNTSPAASATYDSADSNLGSGAVAFKYTVRAGDTSPKLDYTSTGALSGTIKNGTTFATLTLPTLASVNDQISNAKSIVIDAGPAVTTVSVTPTPTNTPPTISANISDSASTVSSAEYFLDNTTGTPGMGTALPLASNGTNAWTATGTLPATSTGATPDPNFANLTDGNHTITVDAQDAQGWGSKLTFTFFKDTTAPTVATPTLSPPPTGYSAYYSTPTFNVSITDNNYVASAEYFVDSGPATALTVSHSGTNGSASWSLPNFATLADGPHTIYVDAKDTAGNVSQQNSINFNVDSKIPVVTSITGPTATNQSPVNFTATFSVPVSLADTTKIVATGGTLGTPTSDITGKIWTIPVTPAVDPSPQAGETISLQLQAGAFQSQGTNYAGVQDPSLASYQVSSTFDDVAPVLTAGGFQSSAFASPYPVGTVLAPTSNNVYLNLTFAENVVITGSVTVHLNNGMTLGNGYFSTGNHNLVTFYGTIPSGVPTGGVALDFASSTPFTGGTITDAAGNAVSIPTPAAGDVLSSQNIQVHATDDVPPVTTLTTVNNSYTTIQPSASGWFNSSPVYFTLSATDLSNSVAHRYYTLDGGAQTEYFSTHVQVTGNGSHTVTYWSVDSVGNIEATNTTTIKIDTSAPTIKLNPPTATGSYGSPYTITGTWSEPISGLSTTAPFSVNFYDYVDHYSYITVGTLTSPSFHVYSNGTWDYTFTPTTAVYSSSISTPVETPNWVITVSATSGAGVGSSSVTTNSGGNIKYTSTPTAVFTSSAGGSGAAGTGILTNGFVTGVTITNGGNGYSQTSPPVVTFTGGGGFNATGIAIVNSSGQVTGVNMGMITVNKATPLVAWAIPADITYGTALSSTQLNATASVPGSFVYSPPLGTVLKAGLNQTLSVTFTPQDTTNYTSVVQTAGINVNQRVLTITATGVNKNYDGNTTATVTLSDDRLPGDVFTDSYVNASFADPYAGTGKTVTVTGLSMSGADAGNYVLASTTTTTTASIIDTLLPVVSDFRVLFGSKSYSLIGLNRDLPWQITGVQVTFNEPVTGSSASLSSTGATNFSVTGFSGTGTNTLTWNVTPLTLGQFQASLAATGSAAIIDAAHSAVSGNNLNESFAVLYGDFNGDRVVSSADTVGVNAAITATYSIFADINGDGSITMGDVSLVRSLNGKHL